MEDIDWNLWAAGAAGIAIGLCALAALTRRKTSRRAALQARAAVSNPKRRIDVVAIDESAGKQGRP